MTCLLDCAKNILLCDSINFQLMLGEIVDKMNLINEFRLLRSSPAFACLNDYWLNRAMQLYVKQTMFEGQVSDQAGV